MTIRRLTRVPLRTADADVIVVGAGVAGLTAAAQLTAAGRRVEVLEADVTTGGRVGSELVDGFTVDHGFHLIYPRQPGLAGLVGLDELDLHPLLPGLDLLLGTDAHGSEVRTVADPRRAPGQLVSTLRAGLRSHDLHSAREVWALLRWARAAEAAGDDLPWPQALAAGGLHGRPAVVAERLLAAMLLEDPGDRRWQATASDGGTARGRLRSFLSGAPALPAHGMVALPVHLTGHLERPVRTGTRVDAVRRRAGSWVVVGDHGTWSAPQVVLATPAGVSAELLHGSGVDLPLPHQEWHGVTTWWFTAEEAPSGSTALRLDARAHRGPVAATAVVTNVSPTYSADGRPLIAALVLHRNGHPEGQEAAVRVHLSELWGTPAFGWEVVARQEQTRGVPVRPAGGAPEAADTPSGLFLAGDHLAPGITGAMESGARAAADALRTG
ncbi:FAD-dependent oxidoreductase [Kytococcus sedentarius]|uniref:FAD-dependent oxidoreductase n=1 Tax=Kytococcus sedentarius TaxID=1276 RepID=UPI0035BBE95A